MDQPALPSVQLRCTQCGSDLHPDAGQIFITCAACQSTVYLDKSRVVFHWYVAPTIDNEKARGQLAQWMAGNQTVKDLDKKARVVSQAFEYFPVWTFKCKVNNKDVMYLEPAAAISITELRNLPLLAGDLRRYEPALDTQAHAPSVPLEAAQKWLAEGPHKVHPGHVAETALVHIPLYTFKYAFQNQTYTALVEAATGKTLANLFPAKSEAPYLVAGGVTALTFACLAFVPIVGALSNNGDDLGLSLAACAGLGMCVAPILFAVAAWVAAKV
jgi:hypothetical protein